MGRTSNCFSARPSVFISPNLAPAMFPISRIFLFTALATSGLAMLVVRSNSTHPNCLNPRIVDSKSLTTGQNAVQIETITCGSATRPVEDITICLPPLLPCPPPPQTTKSSSAPVQSSTSVPVNVCNNACTTSCGSIGDLPPISEDCQAIVNAVAILNGSISPTFDVQTNSIQQLTSGTCRFWFENFNSETLTFCWLSLVQGASAAGTQCFPPTQPVNSAAFCTSTNGSWLVGAGHS